MQNLVKIAVAILVILNVEAAAQSPGGPMVPSGPYSQFVSSSGNIVPFQGAPQQVDNFYSRSYGSEVNSFANVFAVGVVAQTTSTSAAIVAQFGEGVANANLSRAWGGNFVGVATASGASALGVEVDAVATAAGALSYGVVIASAGSAAAQAAIQIQSNNTVSAFVDGIKFNGSVQGVTGSLITATGGISAQFGINLGGTYSTNEILTPSFRVDATPGSINAGVIIKGSASGNPSIGPQGVGGSPATNSNMSVASLGTGKVQLVTGGSGGTVQVEVTSTGILGVAKGTAAAPGASFLGLSAVCGTNAGTAKLQALAGTSATPTTLLDNIGAGFTGC
jgi:hypothetical protein